MVKQLTLMIAAATALAGCDAATQIAGEAVQGEVRNAVAAQCEQISENAGIVSGRVSEVCQCSADTFVSDPDLTMEDVSRERIEGIVNACAESTSAQPGTSSEATPAEEIGG